MNVMLEIKFVKKMEFLEGKPIMPGEESSRNIIEWGNN